MTLHPLHHHYLEQQPGHRPESKMVCTRQAYLARSGSPSSPVGGQRVAVCAAGGIDTSLFGGQAGAVVVSRWKSSCRPHQCRSRASHNTCVVSGLEGCAVVAGCAGSAGRCVELGASTEPLALSLAVRALVGWCQGLGAGRSRLSMPC